MVTQRVILIVTVMLMVIVMKVMVWVMVTLLVPEMVPVDSREPRKVGQVRHLFVPFMMVMTTECMT